MAEPDSMAPRDEALWAELARRIADQMGMHFPRARYRDLAHGVALAAAELGCNGALSCARMLLASPLARPQIEVLARHLSVGETYFFRDPAAFEVLAHRLLPALVQSRASVRRLRIWSAGCCTGEEAYSIAILLARALPDLDDWNIGILATDIDPHYLARGERGEYGSWSFRATPEPLRNAFFTPCGRGTWRVAPRIRALVQFAYLNLAQDPFPSIANGTNAMDLVFCRNVLMYFEPQRARQVLADLGQSLRDDGWLFVNPVEVPHGTMPTLERVNFGSALVFRRARWPVEPAASAPTLPEEAVHRPPADAERAGAEPAGAEPAGAEARVAVPMNAGRVARARSDLRAAATAAARAAEMSPGHDANADADADADAATLAARARGAADRGDLEAALAWCERAVAADKMNPRWHYLNASILQELGRAREAAAALRRTLYLDPGHALAHVALGTLARRAGLAEASARHLRNALATVSAHAPADVLDAFEGMSAGRIAQAIRSSLAEEEHR
ncbi:MAG TPA: protein-glutamate O-methyltransferase CheR [Ramlibacter sp.]|uniref:CheR family methyltransferase n=1 Tax=Ramlibacter sp. TaxID=1917967 RepID=UPI002B857709|nr:protein-glutamate O-methyltransferase CheR [Ramlibacter sp.]HVZ43474.1 protein-glutamate O-methyltransferase CheR [Ramlibacter sp.]